MKLFSRVSAGLPVVVVVALLAGMTGCTGKGGGEYQVAPVKGKISYDGQAVKGGSIRFQPVNAVSGKEGITGKPASGVVGDDGTFVLSTYGKEDGAVIGKHQVSYMPMTVGAQSYDDKPAPSPYAGLVPETKEVEIKAGDNDIRIELIKGS